MDRERLNPVELAQFGLAFWEGQTVRAETAVLRDRFNTLSTERATGRKANAYDAGALLAVRQAGFPVESALAALENVTVAGVQMTSLELNPAEGTAKAELEAQTAQDLDKYLTALSSADHPSGWRVIKIQEASGVPLPAGAPGPLPPGMLPSAAITKPLVPRSTGAVAVVLGWGDGR